MAIYEVVITDLIEKLNQSSSHAQETRCETEVGPEYSLGTMSAHEDSVE